MITCFPFMITVLSILRQGIGLQQSPPNMMLVSLALFLTLFVMEPVFTVAWTKGIAPYGDGAIDFETAFGETMIPFREFMQQRVNPDTLAALADLRPELSSDEPGTFVACSKLYALRNCACISGRIFVVPTFSHHRSCRRRNPDVHGYDDGATSDCITPVQTRIFRCS
jgi:type III secretory pathway component EscR